MSSIISSLTTIQIKDPTKTATQDPTQTRIHA
jgi:hypothetical protein